MASSPPLPLPPLTRPIPPPANPPGLSCTFSWICVYELNDQPPSPPLLFPPEPPSPPFPPPLTEAEILEKEFWTGMLLLWYYTNLALLAAAIVQCVYVLCFRGAPKHGQRPADPAAMPTDASNAELVASKKPPASKGDQVAEKQALRAESGGVASDAEDMQGDEGEAGGGGGGGLRVAAAEPDGSGAEKEPPASKASLPLPLKEGTKEGGIISPAPLSGGGSEDSASRASRAAKRRLEAAEARRSSAGGKPANGK